jgi:hypothetical protein
MRVAAIENPKPPLVPSWAASAEHPRAVAVRRIWIDAAQNGALVRSSAFTGQKVCKAIHKSVRFEIGTGPVTVQISGAPEQKVRLAIRAAN